MSWLSSVEREVISEVSAEPATTTDLVTGAGAEAGGGGSSLSSSFSSLPVAGAAGAEVLVLGASVRAGMVQAIMVPDGGINFFSRSYVRNENHVRYLRCKHLLKAIVEAEKRSYFIIAVRNSKKSPEKYRRPNFWQIMQTIILISSDLNSF